MPRLEQLLELLATDPDDSFVRYALAMEYVKMGMTNQALIEFDELLRRDPKYVAGYFMAGRAQAQNGDIAAARLMYERGIAVANEVGDRHAAGEIAEALAELS